MKILLDENIPVQLKKHLDEKHKWITVKELQWQGTRNAQLLQMLRKHQFDGLLTMDKNLYKQQNMLKFDLFIVVLQAVDNKIPTLLKVVSSLNKLLGNSLQADIYLIKSIGLNVISITIQAACMLKAKVIVVNATLFTIYYI